ncbi:MAG TPA: hypothetical protein VIO64_10635 [Pseudobacteroides sp.]|uniref:hypothetical protein n=1 Tax=Pseudobacteroides sp. TaxID=1968840 RepID=UPI002F946B57
MGECPKHEAHEAEINTMKDDIKDIFKRLIEVEKYRSQSAAESTSRDEAIRDIKADIKDIKTDIKNNQTTLLAQIENLKSKPGERWNDLTKFIMGAIVTLLLAGIAKWLGA